MRVTIINYGLSNLLSVERAFRHFGAETEVTGERGRIAGAQILVLPGVGAFSDGMDGLDRLGLTDIIKGKVSSGTPLLGICLGMQMMFTESDEFGVHKGLGLIEGRVERISGVSMDGAKQRVPHVGWERLRLTQNSENRAASIFEGFPEGGECYFVHSYEGKPRDSACRVADCVYGGREVCAVAANRDGNAVGCQFHPEKSGEAGLSVIDGFLKLARALTCGGEEL